MTYIDEIPNSKNNTCCHDLSVKHRSGVTIINAKPLFTHDFQLVLYSLFYISIRPYINVFFIARIGC